MQITHDRSSQSALHNKSSAVAGTNPVRTLATVLLAGSAASAEGLYFKPAFYSHRHHLSRHSPAERLPQLRMGDVPNNKAGSLENLSNANRILNKLDDSWQMPRKEFVSRAAAALVAGFSADAAFPTKAVADIPQGSIDGGLVLYSTQKGSFKIAQGESIVPTLKARPDTRVICVGEEHPHPLHHAFQLNVIKAVNKMDTSPTLIGLEMFWRQHQPALDHFVYGDAQSGGGSIEMLENSTEWATNWGYAIKLYTDILNYAREKRIRLVGLNAPYPIVREVGRKGLKEVYGMLNAKTLSSMPEVELDNKEHYQRFVDRLGSVSDLSALPSERLQHMYEAQSLWDEYMAASIAKFFEKTSKQQSMSRMVVLAGVGHMQGRVGIPDRVEKRAFVKAYTVIPNSVPWPAVGTGSFPDVQGLSSKEGDWVLYTRRFEDLDSRWSLGGSLVGGWVNA